MALRYKRRSRRKLDSVCGCGVDHSRAFACDAVRQVDPTGTLPRRRALARNLDARWRQVRQTIAAQVGRADMLALSPATSTSQLFAAGADRLTTAQTWIDNVMAQYVLGHDDGEWLAESTRRAYAEGAQRAAERLRRPLSLDYSRATAHGAVAVMELEGVMEAVSQQAMRALSRALVMRASPAAAARAMTKVVEDVGVLRGRMVISVEVVRAYNEGTLDALESAGVEQVGVVPEMVPAAPRLTDARRRPSKRISPYRQGRAERAEARLNELELVNVATAGDYKVCLRCEEIAADGPYSIDEARGLIPAHPSCRCAFEPVEE